MKTAIITVLCVIAVIAILFHGSMISIEESPGTTERYAVRFYSLSSKTAVEYATEKGLHYQKDGFVTTIYMNDAKEVLKRFM
jgi:hypothetical protein